MEKEKFLEAFNQYYKYLLTRLDNGSNYLDDHPEVEEKSSIYKAYEAIISELKEKDFKIADLNRKLAKQECELNRYKNYVRVNTGGEL